MSTARRAEPDRRAVLWARVSTDRQAEQGYSLAAQVEQLREYAAREGLTVVAEHVVSESASRQERKAFDAMMAEVERSTGPRHLLAAEADRLSRSLASDAKLDELRRAGLSIHLVREGRVLGPEASSSELLLLDARAMVARYESRHHGERVMIGMRRKARAGLIPGPLPLGYQLAGPGEPAEPAAETAEIIREIFQACADGTSLDGLAELARRRGLRGRRSKATISKSSLQWILRSPVYQGDVQWDGETHLGLHEPLVSRRLWVRAQLSLDARRTTGRRARKAGRDLELAGVLRCGDCGKALVGELHERSGGRAYTYYRCGPRCGPYVREEVLRESIAGALERVQPTEESAASVRRLVEWELAEGREARGASRSRLLAESERLERRLDAAYTDCADGRLDRERYDRLAAGWRSDHERVREELAELDEGHERGLRLALDVLDVALHAGRAYRRADRALRQEIVATMTRGGTWTAGVLSLELAQPLAALADTTTLSGGRPDWWAVLDDTRTAESAWKALSARLQAA